MIEEKNVLNDSFLSVQLRKQSFKFAIAISFALVIVAVLGIIFIYVVNDPIGSAFVFTATILACFSLVIIQMLCLYKYLRNFQNGDKAQYFMKYLIVATFILFVLSCIAAFIGLVAEPYTIIICLIPQFLVGWQLVKINMRGNDFVGGLSFLGPVMCTSAILFPLIVLLPILVGYVFIKAYKYTELYGFNTH